jgi:hypothetical protein
MKAIQFIAFALLFHSNQNSINNNNSSYHSAALDSFSSRLVQSLICAADDPNTQVQTVAYSALLLLAIRLTFAQFQPLLIQAQATQEQQNKLKFALQQWQNSGAQGNIFNGITLLELNDSFDGMQPRRTKTLPNKPSTAKSRVLSSVKSNSTFLTRCGSDEEDEEDEDEGQQNVLQASSRSAMLSYSNLDDEEEQNYSDDEPLDSAEQSNDNVEEEFKGDFGSQNNIGLHSWSAANSNQQQQQQQQQQKVTRTHNRSTTDYIDSARGPNPNNKFGSSISNNNWQNDRNSSTSPTPSHGRRAVLHSNSMMVGHSSTVFPSLNRSASPVSITSSVSPGSRSPVHQLAHSGPAYASHTSSYNGSILNSTEEELPAFKSINNSKESSAKAAIWLKDNTIPPEPLDRSVSVPVGLPDLNNNASNSNGGAGIAAKLRNLKLKSRPTSSALHVNAVNSANQGSSTSAAVSSAMSQLNNRAVSAFVRRGVDITYNNSTYTSSAGPEVPSPHSATLLSPVSASRRRVNNLSASSNEPASPFLLNHDNPYDDEELANYTNNNSNTNNRSPSVGSRVRPSPPPMLTINQSANPSNSRALPSKISSTPTHASSNRLESAVKSRAVRSQSLAAGSLFANSGGGSAVADDSNYLSTAELQPFDSPAEGLKGALKSIKSSDWQQRFESVNALRRLAVNHTELITGQIKTLIRDIRGEVDSLRSSLSRNSLMLLTELFQNAARLMEPELEVIFPSILKRSGESNAFLAEEANKCLTVASQCCNEVKTINTLINLASTGNKVIKQQSIVYMDKVVQHHGAKLVQQAQQQQFFSNAAIDSVNDSTPLKPNQFDFGRIVKSIANHCSEAAVVSRQAARQSLTRLTRVIGINEMDKLLKKLLQGNKYVDVKKALDKELGVDMSSESSLGAPASASHARVSSALMRGSIITGANSATAKRMSTQVRNISNDSELSPANARIQSAYVPRGSVNISTTSNVNSTPLRGRSIN